MGLFGLLGSTMGLLGSTWVYLGLLGSTWGLLGSTWGLLGSTWVYLGLLGSTWPVFVYLGLTRAHKPISVRDGRLSPSASLLRAPYGANNVNNNNNSRNGEYSIQRYYHRLLSFHQSAGRKKYSNTISFHPFTNPCVLTLCFYFLLRCQFVVVPSPSTRAKSE